VTYSFQACRADHRRRGSRGHHGSRPSSFTVIEITHRCFLRPALMQNAKPDGSCLE
jgi:hypothetical protein